nr:hypothetical protein [Tanacetum cinerariifolium]
MLRKDIHLDVVRTSRCHFRVWQFFLVERIEQEKMLLEHQDVILEFGNSSWWKELSKEMGSEILPSGDGSRRKTFKPIARLIAKGKLK